MDVSEIRVGTADAAGVLVDDVYSFNPPHYAVYRTARRVMVHFADEFTGEQAKQRAALAQINPLRGQIDGLLDGWQGPEAINAASAARADRRIADALTLALEQDLANATLYLTQLKSDIEQERAARARRFYVIAAALTGAVLIVAMLIVLGLMTRGTTTIVNDVRGLMVAAGAGVIGAFFSSALAIRDRTPMNDLRLWDTVVDAVLRIVIGFIGGMVLYALFRTQVVSSIAFGKEAGALKPDPTSSDYNWMMVAVIGFVAGFVERLVGNLLAKSTLAAGAGDQRAPVPPGPPDAGAGRGAGAATGAAAGLGAAALALQGDGDEGDDIVDGCDARFDPTQETTDEELPAATGGVEGKA
jgi:hypothetical protein